MGYLDLGGYAHLQRSVRRGGKTTLDSSKPVTSATAIRAILKAVATPDTTSLSKNFDRLPKPTVPGTSINRPGTSGTIEVRSSSLPYRLLPTPRTRAPTKPPSSGPSRAPPWRAPAKLMIPASTIQPTSRGRALSKTAKATGETSNATHWLQPGSETGGPER